MDANHKKVLRGLSLELRHVLEGDYDEQGRFKPGDLERRLNEMGVWRERSSKPIDELPHLSQVDKVARKVVDAYIKFRDEVGVPHEEAVAEYVRESAYTWANRLLALRCMEARGLIDEIILQKDVYGGRSLVHNRFARKNPEACSSEDDGLFAVLFQEFIERSKELPALFSPNAPAVVLRPSVAAIKKCIALFSGRELVNGQGAANDEVFAAHDAFGWAYQYWNEEEKKRVLNKVRTKKGAKIEGADIISYTQLYTEPYMVKFLVQNSLGALWIGVHPESKLYDKWEYYLKDADRAPVEKKAVSEITFLDPAEGSGHFHLEAFDLLYELYLEEGVLKSSESICASILNKNLFGIDIDERAVQISKAVLWMKAKEKAPDLKASDLNAFHDHFVATNIRLPKSKDHLKAFLNKHPEDEQLRPALETVFEGLQNAHELGSLLQIEEPVEKELRFLKEQYKAKIAEGYQKKLFGPTIIQGQLPEGVESYEDWKSGSLARLKAHFSSEAEAADLTQSFFSQSAEKGLLLFDLLARRYDVVAANPPYMGSKNMGPMLKSYISKYYVPGKHDFYAAFILRNLNLTNPRGRVAMVTRQSWMFLRSFADLRAPNNEKIKKMDKDAFKGLLRETTIETLAHLGPHAFGEITGEVVNVVIFTIANATFTEKHRLTAIRVIGPKNPEEKDKLLRLMIANGITLNVIKQQDILDVPTAPITYWLGPGAIRLLKGSKIGDYAEIVQQIITANNPRFLRYAWETPNNTARWHVYLKAGGYKKWIGFEQTRVDWEQDGIRLKESIIAKYPYLKGNSGWLLKTDSVGKPSLTYSLMAQGSLGVRRVPNGAMCDSVSPTIILTRQWPGLAAWLNTRSCSFLLRSISSEIKFRESYVARTPVSSNLPESLASAEEWLTKLKLALVARDATEDEFVLRTENRNLLLHEAWLITGEGWVENIVCSAQGFSPAELSQICETTGTPAGWFSLISGFDALPKLPEGLSEAPKELIDNFSNFKRRACSINQITDLKSRLRALYEAGPGAKFEEISEEDTSEDAEEEDKSEVIFGAHIPIPTETFLEEISVKLEIHPISIYWLLKEGIEKEDWHCLPEERRFMEDNFSIMVIRLLGHCWPRQIKAGEPVPDWADKDGIIPITECYGEKILLERVRERIANEFPGGIVTSIEREFEEIVGMSLEKWLSGPFFVRQISQFKKRPIVWIIESKPISNPASKGRKRSSRASSEPVFSCLVYYHKLDSDLLPKIRTQYVGPLKIRYETELRVLERTKNPTADQSARKVQLGNWIEELKTFDLRLETVIRDGFDSDILKNILDKEPLDIWTSRDGAAPHPNTKEELIIQEKRYYPDINDGVRVNIAPLQKAGLLATDVIANKDIDKAISDRAEWRADERRWCRQGKLPKPGWWKSG